MKGKTIWPAENIPLRLENIKKELDRLMALRQFDDRLVEMKIISKMRNLLLTLKKSF